MEGQTLDNPKTDKTVVVYEMSEDQISAISRLASEVAIRQYKEDAKKNRKKLADKRYHNTELLLENYYKLKLSVENAVFDIKQVEKEQGVRQILDLMMGYNNSDFVIQSVKNSKVKTAMILKHIDAMLAAYKSLCMNSSDELDERRYNILVDRYFTLPRLSTSEISEKYYLSIQTVYGDLKASKNALSTLIFGIDGMMDPEVLDEQDPQEAPLK